MMPFVPSDYAVSILGMIDKRPKYEIEKVPFEESRAAISVVTEKGRQGYYVNSLLDDEHFRLTAVDIVDFAARGARARVQLENENLEIFPGLSPKEVGSFRRDLEPFFQVENYSLTEIDYFFFGWLASRLWLKEQVYALPKIRQIVPMNAAEIIKFVEPIICST